MIAEAEPHGEEEQTDSDVSKEIVRSVELTGLVFPVFDEDGSLQNYIFVNARLVVADSKDPWKYREQAHFIRDALITASHRESLNKAGNYQVLDQERAEKVCLAAANKVVGEPDAMVAMTFTQIASQGQGQGQSQAPAQH